MSIAFVLVNTELTSDMEIIGKIKDILTTEKDVEYEIQGVYGIYDIMLKISSDNEEKLEIIGLYWHFVDVVWIVIFTIVYLFPQ